MTNGTKRKLYLILTIIMISFSLQCLGLGAFVQNVLLASPQADSAVNDANMASSNVSLARLLRG